MNKTCLSLLAVALFCVVTASSYAQGPGGCINSPENPTAVLAVIGSAGAVFFSRRKL